MQETWPDDFKSLGNESQYDLTEDMFKKFLDKRGGIILFYAYILYIYIYIFMSLI